VSGGDTHLAGGILAGLASLVHVGGTLLAVGADALTGRVVILDAGILRAEGLLAGLPRLVSVGGTLPTTKFGQ